MGNMGECRNIKTILRKYVYYHRITLLLSMGYYGWTTYIFLIQFLKSETKVKM